MARWIQSTGRNRAAEAVVKWRKRPAIASAQIESIRTLGISPLRNFQRWLIRNNNGSHRFRVEPPSFRVARSRPFGCWVSRYKATARATKRGSARCEFDAEIVPFDRRAKAGMLLEIVRKTRSRKYENRGSRGNWNRRRSCRHYRAGHTGHTVRG